MAQDSATRDTKAPGDGKNSATDHLDIPFSRE
jgi:hypothetical protein